MQVIKAKFVGKGEHIFSCNGTNGRVDNTTSKCGPGLWRIPRQAIPRSGAGIFRRDWGQPYRENWRFSTTSTEEGPWVVNWHPRKRRGISVEISQGRKLWYWQGLSGFEGLHPNDNDWAAVFLTSLWKGFERGQYRANTKCFPNFD